MRKLISLAVACLVLLPATGIRAEVFPFAGGDDPGGERSGGGGEVGDDPRGSPESPDRVGSRRGPVSPDRVGSRGASGSPDRVGGGGEVGGIPSVAITSAPDVAASDATFTVTITFSETVDDFDVTDIDVVNASTIGDVSETTTDLVFTVQIRTKSDFEGKVTVTVPAGAAESTSTNQGNTAGEHEFPVDTKAPELLTAVADGTAITLTYHEEVDDAGDPGVAAFTVSVKRAGETGAFTDLSGLADADAEDEVVTITLNQADAIQPGDSVQLDYTGTTLRDARGNPAPALTDNKVDNANSLSVPEAVDDLAATGKSTTEIELTWTAPNAGSSAITGYQIQARPNQNRPWGIVEANTGNTNLKYTHGNLTPDTTVQYQIFAINSQGMSPASNTAEATTKREGNVPDAPTGLRATAQGPNQINLAWTAPANTGTSAINGYRIEFAAAATGPWSDLVTNTGSTSTSYPNSGLQPNTTRYYRVRAINQTGESEPSNVDHATTTTVITAPQPPTSLSATAQGANINLSWTAPSDDGGAAIQNYKIEKSDDGGTTWTDLVANTGNTNVTYTDNTVSAGSTRHYRVSARNSAGTSQPSNVANATRAATAPGRPTGLTATAQSTTQINLTWTAPSDDGGAAITGYEIEESNNGSTWTDLASTTSTSHSVAGLSAGSTRYYRVYAVNSAGTSSASDIANATTWDIPSAPRSLRARPIGQTQIDLQWSAPADTGGVPIAGYQIEVSSDGSNWTIEVEDTLARSYSHVNLTSGSTWYYRVSARNQVGMGPTSTPVRATTAAGRPSAPVDLIATPAGRTRIDLDWDPPAYDGGSPVTGYRIEVSVNGGGTWDIEVGNTESTSTRYAHTGLTPDTTLHYRVSAINVVDNVAGAGEPSDEVSATTAPDVPDAPTGLTATAAGQTQIDLAWNAPADDNGAEVTGYRIEASRTGTSGWSAVAEDTRSTDTEYSHTGLTPDTTLYYRVSAINSQGAGPASNVDDATTDPTVPDAPGNLTAAADGQSKIILVWSPPAYDGGARVTGYQVEVSTDSAETWTVLRANTGTVATSFVDTGLAPGSTRHYRVSAINSAGVGAASRVANATTEATLPGAPSNLEAAADGPFAINLDWDEPSYDGGSPVTGYRIEVSTTRGVTWRTLEENTGLTVTSYSHTDLPPATTRHYRVSAINAKGASLPSNTAHATTEADLPGAPTDLAAAAEGTSRIILQWNAPDYDGGASISGYRIEVSEDEGATWGDLVEDTESNRTRYTHSDLAPASTRHYRVSAINEAGTGEPSNEANATTDATTPDAPTNLTAAADGTSRIVLDWNAPAYDGGAEVEGYRIEVSENGLSWDDLVANTESTRTAYTHAGLAPASRRHYRVSAVNRVGPGDASNVAEATTDATTPDAPTNLTAMADGTSRIDLDWNAPGYDGGASVTGYRIEVSDDGGSTWEDLEEDTRSRRTEYTHEDLAPASTRHYRVSAVNRVGPGEPSNEAEATTDATTPDAPTDLTAEADGTSRIDLDWNAPDYDGGADIEGYRIEVSENGGSTWDDLVSNTQTTRTRYTHTNLAPASARHYRVSAVNRVGPGEPSNEAEATTDATVPNAPANLTANAADHERIDLDWDVPDFDGGAAISGYRIEVSDDGGGTWADLVADTRSTATDYAHTGLDPASARHYRVSAINEIGTGAPSNVADATTDAIAPDPPTNLAAAATSPTTIELTWMAPAYDGGAPVASYRIEVSADGAAWADLQSSTGVPTTRYVHVVEPGSTRFYRVSAINAAGVGAPSNIATATTDDPVQRAGRVNAAILPHFAAAATTSTMSAIAGRIETVASRNPTRSQLSAAGLLSRAGNMGLSGRGGGLDVGRLFDGASVAMSLGGGQAQEDDSPAGFTTWAGAEHTTMSEPSTDDIDWDGTMLSVHIGADMRFHRDFLAGLAGSRSAGNYDFTDATGAREVAGTYEATLTSLNPYLAWLPGRKGVSAWAAGTFGWGTVTIEDEPAGQRSSDTRSRGGAVGGSRVLMTSGASEVRVRAEGWMSQVEVQGGPEMDSLTLDMQRLRVSLEWSQLRRLSSGSEVNIMAEGGLRYGDGDGTEGSGMEIGGGIRFASASKALTMEGHGRLLATSPNEYKEWGVRGLLQIDPQAVNRRGLLVKIVPAWGQSASGVQELYERGVANRPGMGYDPRKGRVDTRVEYGLGDFGGTPYGRFHVADGGARAFGTGMTYSITRVLDLRFEGTRTERADGPARHGLAMRGRWVF